MKRRVLRLLLFLLLGAIINVAVAWGCAYFVGPRNPADELAAIGPGFDTGVTLWRRSGAVRYFVCENQRCENTSWVNLSHIKAINMQLGEGLELYVTALQSNKSRPVQLEDPRDFKRALKLQGDFPILAVDLRGWPVRSVGCEFVPAPDTSILVEAINYGVLVPPHQARPLGTTPMNWIEIRVLPLRPIWPGFAINTIFYAAIVWALLAVPGYIKRIVGGRRIKRGVCVRCAYPVGANEKCTECGTPTREGYGHVRAS